MNITIDPGKLKGTIRAVDSKSHAHRLLIATAMAADSFSSIANDMISDPSEDLSATTICLKALLNHSSSVGSKYNNAITSSKSSKESCYDELPAFYCGESGSTLRFILPLSVAAGRGGVFYGGGKLPQRPLAPLDEELIKHGAIFEFPTFANTLAQHDSNSKENHLANSIDERSSNNNKCQRNTSTDHGAACGQQEICRISLPKGGFLKGGKYSLPGHISSQYITGLLMALPLIHEDSTITITTPLQSRAYVDITLAVLREFGIEVIVTDNNETTDPANCPVYHIKGGQRYTTPHIDAGRIHPEGDWSNGAFWLVADALGSDINVSNLRDDSPQGDKAITEIIKKYNSVRLDNECNDEMPDTCDKEIAIDASGIPDLVPIISVLAALSPVHTRIVNAGRLRIKESDRLKTTCEMLGALGANISETEDGLEIEGRESLDGGTAHGAGDHRIVMAAAIAATCCKKPVTIIGAEAAAKSYPRFFEDYAWLGGVISIIS